MATAHTRVVAAVAKPAVRNRRMQRACAGCGAHASGECEACKKKKLQRRAGVPRSRHERIDVTSFESGGRPLDPGVRQQLEPLYGADFAAVRIHDDASSYGAAERLSAHAFTVGQHIHFARGRYQPDQRAGLHLLAHELTHTVQQRGVMGGAALTDSVEVDPVDSPFEREADHLADLVTHAAVVSDSAPSAPPAPARARTAAAVQRVGFDEILARLFFEGTFSEEELLRYVKFLDDHAVIEGDYDSDNKAREIIRRWRRDDPKFSLTIEQKKLMLLEMIDGPTLDDDEEAIHELLRGSGDADIHKLLATAGGEGALKDEFHGPQFDELNAFLEQWHRKPGNQAPPESGRRGAVREVVVDQDTPQTVTVRYADGSSEGDTCSTGKGTCCVEPGTTTGPTPAQSQQNDSNWTPVGRHTVMNTPHSHGSIRWWTQFHWRAIALHDYPRVDGTPLSHGCVRLHDGIAQRIREGAVAGRTVVRVIGSARPRCDHGALVDEWSADFDGGLVPDGDRELRKHLEVSFGARGTALDQKLAQRVIPRCGGGAGRRGTGGGGRRP